MTIQAFCSLSLDPPLVLICPSLASTSWPRIDRRGVLCINVLGESRNPCQAVCASRPDKIPRHQMDRIPTHPLPDTCWRSHLDRVQRRGDLPGG